VRRGDFVHTKTKSTWRLRDAYERGWILVQRGGKKCDKGKEPKRKKEERAQCTGILFALARTKGGEDGRRAEFGASSPRKDFRKRPGR